MQSAAACAPRGSLSNELRRAKGVLGAGRPAAAARAAPPAASFGCTAAAGAAARAAKGGE